MMALQLHEKEVLNGSVGALVLGRTEKITLSSLSRIMLSELSLLFMASDDSTVL